MSDDSPKPPPRVIEANIHAVGGPAKAKFTGARPKPGALVEATDVAGTEGGQIVPKDPAGLVEDATDPRERKSEKPSGPAAG
jgi:hypothetical protein